MIYCIYFSPAGTTKAITLPLAKQLGEDIVEVDLSQRELPSLSLTREDTAVVGIPVYGGRVPTHAAEKLAQLTSDGGRAVAVAVYGNRHYDDALLELGDILSAQGFLVIAGGAFIAQHSIAPVAGTGRPDAADQAEIAAFGQRVSELLANDQIGKPDFPGNRPYRENNPSQFPIACSEDCIACGICSAGCPTGAIEPAAPRETDGGLCIRCMRCVHICPKKARHLDDETYGKLAGFLSQFEARRPNEVFFSL